MPLVINFLDIGRKIGNKYMIAAVAKTHPTIDKTSLTNPRLNAINAETATTIIITTSKLFNYLIL